MKRDKGKRNTSTDDPNPNLGGMIDAHNNIDFWGLCFFLIDSLGHLEQTQNHRRGSALGEHLHLVICGVGFATA